MAEAFRYWQWRLKVIPGEMYLVYYWFLSGKYSTKQDD